MNIFQCQYLISFNERAGIRTPDNLIKSQVLYHLSYTPKPGVAGFEPAVQESESWALPLGDTPLLDSSFILPWTSAMCQHFFSKKSKFSQRTAISPDYRT